MSYSIDADDRLLLSVSNSFEIVVALYDFIMICFYRLMIVRSLLFCFFAFHAYALFIEHRHDPSISQATTTSVADLFGEKGVLHDLHDLENLSVVGDLVFRSPFVALPDNDLRIVFVPLRHHFQDMVLR